MNLLHWPRIHILSMLTVAVAGCSDMPAFGPNAETIERATEGGSAQGENLLPFQIVDVTAETLPNAPFSAGSFPAAFRTQALSSHDDVVKIGDVLNIQIWEVSDDGLFSTAGDRETVFTVQVSNSGSITVPYADSVKAQGLTAAELREELLERYKGQAVTPEISVAITGTEARSATVLGDVGTPGRFEVGSRGLRLLDLLAQAGGTSQAPWETLVHVQRGGVAGVLSLDQILDETNNNIVILPGDTIHIDIQPRRFAVYGGVSRPSNVEIPIEDANLAYLLAEVGGLDDRIAQTRSIFVFRSQSGGSATAYRFDFSRADSLFLASAFRLHPTDITYVASADAADFQRFVSIVLSPLLGAASTTSNLGN